MAYEIEPVNYQKWFEKNIQHKKTCKFCSDYTQKHEDMHGKNAWFSLYEHYMEVVNVPNVSTFKIKYCPMCGRNLGDGN